MSSARVWLTLAALGCAALHAPAQEAVQDFTRRHFTGSLCIDCHEDLDGELGEAVAEWAQSTHAEMDVGCEGCHEGDPQTEAGAHSPAMGFIGVPRISEVPYFCGKCHEDIKRRHLGSPHGAQGLPHCVTCHGDHAIGPPRPGAIITEEACSKCHSYEPAAKALQALDKGRELLAEVEKLAGRVQHIPGVEKEVAAVQKEMRLDRAGIVTTFHSFRIGDIEQIGMNADRLKKTLDRLIEREQRREANLAREIPLILSLVVFLLFASVLGFFVYHGKGTVEPGK